MPSSPQFFNIKARSGTHLPAPRCRAQRSTLAVVPASSRPYAKVGSDNSLQALRCSLDVHAPSPDVIPIVH